MAEGQGTRQALFPRKLTPQGGGHKHFQAPGLADPTVHTGASAGSPSDVHHSSPKPHLYLYLARGPHSPGLILAMVGLEVVYEMPKETAGTCEQQRQRGRKGDTGRSSRQDGISEGPETPQTSRSVAFEAAPATARCWRPLVYGGARIHLDLLP